MKRLPLRWPRINEPPAEAPLPPLRQRLLWMALIWAGSVTALTVVGLLLKLVLKA